jgi:hypothetical protein
MLRSRPLISRFALFAVKLLLAGTACGAEPAPDPAVSEYGSLNPAAPAELATFSFLVGTWAGTGTFRDPQGTLTSFDVQWIGRYVLNGMAIADEVRRPEVAGGTVDGISLRYFDAGTKAWTIEFVNFVQSFLRAQVNPEAGAVTQDGARITVAQSGPGGAPGREVYTVVDASHFTYSMDFSRDDGTWNEGIVTMALERQE